MSDIPDITPKLESGNAPKAPELQNDNGKIAVLDTSQAADCPKISFSTVQSVEGKVGVGICLINREDKAVAVGYLTMELILYIANSMQAYLKEQNEKAADEKLKREIKGEVQ